MGEILFEYYNHEISNYMKKVKLELIKRIEKGSKGDATVGKKI